MGVVGKPSQEEVKEENNQREAAWLLRDRETCTLTLGAVCVMMWKMPCSENSGELDFRERLFVFCHGALG